MFSVNWEPKRGKGVFVRELPRGGRVLDVGCGNNSPRWFRQVRPDLCYVGIDVGHYAQDGDPTSYADEYVICEPAGFAEKIRAYSNSMDAVVSSHNLEHCNEPRAVLEAMLQALKPGGRLYLSFPCEESVHFPKRGGCLNFYDDSTHREVPDWESTLQVLREGSCEFEFVSKRYRPFPLWVRGLMYEPVSMLRKHVAPHNATWALYGFESVIWARKAGQTNVVRDWGARTTRVGDGVNVQPSGASAIWVVVENFVPFGDVHIEFSGQRGRGPATYSDGLLTAEIPDGVIHKEGRYAVEIVERSGRRTSVGVFEVGR